MDRKNGSRVKSRYVFLLGLLLLILLPESLSAQGGLLSPYSAFGVGSIQPYMNVRNMGMGGIAVGLSGKGDMNPLNPATYRTGVDTLSVRFDIGFNLGMNGLRERRPDGSIARNQSTSGGLSNLEFYFPVCKWYKMAIYLMPATDMHYRTSSFTDAGAFIGMTQLTHDGSGGIAKAGWGHSLGWGPVSIGANLIYEFGTVTESSTLSFLDDSLAAHAGQSEYYTTTKVNGFAADVGVTYRAKLKRGHFLTLGGSYTFQSKLYGRRTTMGQGVFTSGIDTAFLPEAARKGTIVYPSTVRAGFSFEREGQYVVGADFSYSFWEQYEEYGQKYNYQNTYAVNVGAELKNNPQAVSKARHFAYRIGAFYQTYYAAYGGNNLTSFGLSLGLGIPIRKSRSLINVGFQYGRIGFMNKGQIAEDYFRIGISLSSLETWFVKPKYD